MTGDRESEQRVVRLGLAGALIILLIVVPSAALAVGTGAFVPHPTKPNLAGGNSQDLALADLDGDGDLDAVFVNGGGEAETVWLNDGAGNYTPHPTAPSFGAGLGNTYAIDLGDLDGDGDPDAVVAHGDFSSGPQDERVWLNDGTGVFTPHPTTPLFGGFAGTGPGFDSRDVALGDLDDDGDLDVIVVANGVPSGSRTICAWFNDGAGNFSGNPLLSAFGGPGSSMAVVLGDVDSDNDLDAVVAYAGTRGEEVWLNDGAGGFVLLARFGAQATRAIALGDIDGDADLDAVVANPSVEADTIWINNGGGIFTAHPTTPALIAVNTDTRDLALGDLDADGDLDVVFANANQPETVWLNDGAGNFSSHPTTPTFGAGHSLGVALGDLDNDGDPDVVIANSFNQAKTVWLNVNVQNVAPDADAGGPYLVAEGSSVTLDGSGSSDPDVDDTLSYEWDLDGDGVFGETGADASRGDETGVSPTFSTVGLDGPLDVAVTLRVTDAAGASDTGVATVSVTNAAPTVALGPGATIDEGGSFTGSGTFSDPGPDSWTATVDYGEGSGVVPLALNTDGSFDLEHAYADDGVYTVMVVVDDDDGGAGSAALAVNVNNVAPSVSTISGPLDPVEVNTPVTVTTSFTDPGVLDTHTAVIDWGDSSATSADELTQGAGGGSVAASHSYTAAGVYTVTLTVMDADGAADQAIYLYVVAYDPDAGFVTGSGSIASPAGAYAADPLLAGTARFGFISKYKKGANVPDGQTRVQFQAAGLRFESTAYEWLVIAGAKAQFKGSGQINGAGNYGFMLTAVDGDFSGESDTFRIRIWDQDDGDAVVYDNHMGAASDANPSTELTSGSIVIHTPKK